ncbi:MAG: glycosyltransferase family 4 protein [Acidimicrobiales bacterium]
MINAYDAIKGFDIVHDHTIFGPLYAERFPGLNVVTTIHGVIDDDLADILRAVAPRVQLIAISATQCEAVPDLSVAAVIHHGLDAARFPFESGPRAYTLFMGRMAPEKGAHRAIRAATRAGVPLVLMGKMRSTEEQAYFRNEVEPRLDADKNIFYVGEVDERRKLELLSKARCLLFPIKWKEPFGIVLLEALACGTPVIAFGRGAVPEIIEPGRTGFICRDEQEMAEAIHRIDELDPGACRAAVESHFSAARMVDDHLRLFERILSRSAATSRWSPSARRTRDGGGEWSPRAGGSPEAPLADGGPDGPDEQGQATAAAG